MKPLTPTTITNDAEIDGRLLNNGTFKGGRETGDFLGGPRSSQPCGKWDGQMSHASLKDAVRSFLPF